MTLHRDASNRLVAAFDVDACAYEPLVARLVERFGLTRTGAVTQGHDEVLAAFASESARIGLEWDVWLGFQIVAQDAASEALVTAIAAFVGGLLGGGG